jgi:hypothetical protein
MIRHSIRSRRLELEKRCLVVNQKQMLRLMREANLLTQPRVCGDRRSVDTTIELRSEVGAFAFNKAAIAVGLLVEGRGAEGCGARSAPVAGIARHCQHRT